jgi:adenylate cyclase
VHESETGHKTAVLEAPLTDARIERRLAAILAADVVGFSALMERDEEGTYARVGRLRREVIEPRLSDHQGRLIKTTGDGFLAKFASPIAALRCALAIQSNLTNNPDALRLRIGLNLGDVIVEKGGDVYGDGVNVAARLEALADPGGILISGKIHAEVEGKVEATFEDRGEQQVKNITRPVRIYAVRPVGAASTSAAAILSQFDPGKPLPLPDKPSIAVLPFQNMSGDPEQEYFVDGIVEDIITALSRVKWFFVIARNSSFTYKGRAVDVRQVGRELGVRYVLEGSIRKSGNRVRITGQLIEAATGNHVWADKFEGSLEDVFELQDRITETVVGAIEPSVTTAEIRRSRVKPTGSLDAYDLFLRALSRQYGKTRESLDEALQLLDKAIALDPNFAVAKGLAAFIHCLQFFQSWATADDISKGVRLAHEALHSSFDEPITIALAAYSLAILSREFDVALDAMDRAIYMNPNSAQILVYSALLRTYVSDADRAIEEFSRSIRLNPFDPSMSFTFLGLALALLIKGDYEKALEYARRSAREIPFWISAWRAVAVASVKTDRLQEAQEAVRRILFLSPHYSIAQARRGLPFRDEWVCEMFVDGLRKAGLPE